MTVFILHNHLHTGGVTKVIHSQIQALQALSGSPINIKLLLGEKPDEPVPGLPKEELLISSGLKYLSANHSPRALKARRSAIMGFLKKHVAPADIIHVHNVNLGKNPVLLAALYQLGLEGYKILNHCHDFAEDGRFGNYTFLKKVINGVFGLPLAPVLYPDIPGYHFAALTTRDVSILKKAGIAQSHIHLLMNPVSLAAMDKHTLLKPGAILEMLGIKNPLPLYTYPVRAIRRKNIGEFLLLAALFPEKGNWIITQNPKNPAEWPAYNYWKRQVRQHNLQVVLEAGNRTDFTSLLAGSSRIFTTSVKEGFGLGFLEPWLLGVPIAGRDIPALTKDFKAMGIQFKQLYRRIRVPVQWLSSPDLLVARYAAYVKRACRQLENPVPEGLKESFHRCLFLDGTVDFALLDRAGQAAVISRVVDRDSDRQFLVSLNRLGKLFTPTPRALVNQNRTLVRRHLGLRQYGRSLQAVYRRLSGEPAASNTRGPLSNADNPLTRIFTGLEHFFLINNQ